MMQMAKEGKTDVEIAKYFNVNPSAVSKKRRRVMQKLNLLPQATRKEIDGDNIDTVDQLKRMNRTILKELARSQKLIEREDVVFNEKYILEEQLKKDPSNTELAQRLREKGISNINEILKIQTSILSISAEIRRQIELQVKIYETIYNVEMISEFQKDIIEILKEVDTGLRDSVIKKLKERRSMRGLLRLDKPGL